MVVYVRSYANTICLNYGQRSFSIKLLVVGGFQDYTD